MRIWKKWKSQTLPKPPIFRVFSGPKRPLEPLNRPFLRFILEVGRISALGWEIPLNSSHLVGWSWTLACVLIALPTSLSSANLSTPHSGGHGAIIAKYSSPHIGWESGWNTHQGPGHRRSRSCDHRSRSLMIDLHCTGDPGWERNLIRTHTRVYTHDIYYIFIYNDGLALTSIYNYW